jgi:hypothetical protein
MEEKLNIKNELLNLWMNELLKRCFKVKFK